MIHSHFIFYSEEKHSSNILMKNKNESYYMNTVVWGDTTLQYIIFK